MVTALFNWLPSIVCIATSFLLPFLNSLSRRTACNYMLERKKSKRQNQHPSRWSIKFVILKFSSTIDDFWMFFINYSDQTERSALTSRFQAIFSLSFACAKEIVEKVKLLQFNVNDDERLDKSYSVITLHAQTKCAHKQKPQILNNHYFGNCTATQCSQRKLIGHLMCAFVRRHFDK